MHRVFGARPLCEVRASAPRVHAGEMTDIRATLTAKLAELDEQMAAMAKKPTEQGSISFGKRIGEGTSMAVDRLAQVAVHDQYQVTRADVVRALEKLDEEHLRVVRRVWPPDRRGSPGSAAVGGALRRGRRPRLRP